MGRVHAQKLGAYWLTSVGSLAMQYSFSIIFVDLLVAFDSTCLLYTSPSPRD